MEISFSDAFRSTPRTVYGLLMRAGLRDATQEAARCEQRHRRYFLLNNKAVNSAIGGIFFSITRL